MIRSHHILALAGLLLMCGCAVDGDAAKSDTSSRQSAAAEAGKPSAVPTDPEARAGLMKVSEPLGVAFGVPRGWTDLSHTTPERLEALQKEAGLTAAELEEVARSGGIITMSLDNKVRVSLLAAPGTALPKASELAETAAQSCGAKPEVTQAKAGGSEGLTYHCSKDGRFKHVFVGKSNKSVFTLSTNSSDEALSTKIQTQAVESIHYL